MDVLRMTIDELQNSKRLKGLLKVLHPTFECTLYPSTLVV